MVFDLLPLRMQCVEPLSVVVSTNECRDCASGVQQFAWYACHWTVFFTRIIISLAP